MFSKILEWYLNSPFDVPAAIKQSLVNWIVALDNRLCVFLSANYSPGAPESEYIAESSTELMALHYDQPLHMFEHILGSSMKYSMGLWENGASTLEEAQQAMMADLCNKGEIEDGHNILDIGCGFGSFAEYVLANYPNCTVTGLTLSRVQADYIRSRQKQADHPLHGKRFKLVQEDFNSARLKEKFDRVVSIGVWEHVSNLDKAQAKVREFLHPDGKVLLHYIVYFEALAGITKRPLQSIFVSKYIFPAGRIWSADDLPKYQNDLAVERTWQLNGMNYERTIACWLTNLRNNQNKLKKRGIERRTIKLWEFYFSTCIALFHANRGRYYGNAQYLLTPVRVQATHRSPESALHWQPGNPI